MSNIVKAEGAKRGPHHLGGQIAGYKRERETGPLKQDDEHYAHSSEDDDELPDGFVCPITQEVMKDPVMLTDSGITYERVEIQKWLLSEIRQGHFPPVCPSTKIQCPTANVKENVNLRKAIQSFVEMKRKQKQMLRIAGILNSRQFEKEAQAMGVWDLPESGTEISRFSTQRPISVQPCLSKAGDTLFICTSNRKVHKVAIKEMSKEWEVGTDGYIYHLSISNDGEDLFLGYANSLHNLKTCDGTKVEGFARGQTSGSLCASTDGNYLFVRSEERVCKLKIGDGEREWQYAAMDGFSCAPCEHGGNLYVTSDGGRVHKLRSSDGGKMWVSQLEGELATLSVSMDGQQVFVCSSTKVFKLEASSGQKVWEFITRGESTCSPSADGLHVFVCSSEAKVCKLRASDGVMVWERNLGGCVKSAPCVGKGDGAVFVGTDVMGKSMIYKLRGSDGKLEWQFKADGGVRYSPTLSSDGLYLFAVDTKAVYKIVA